MVVVSAAGVAIVVGVAAVVAIVGGVAAEDMTVLALESSNNCVSFLAALAKQNQQFIAEWGEGGEGPQKILLHVSSKEQKSGIAKRDVSVR